jgi:hypothetical protein
MAFVFSTLQAAQQRRPTRGQCQEAPAAFPINVFSPLIRFAPVQNQLWSSGLMNDVEKRKKPEFFNSGFNTKILKKDY